MSAAGSDVVYYDAVSDGSGGASLVWNYTENGNKVLRAQRLDADGNKLWGGEGKMVSTVPAYWAAYAVPARIAPDGKGGFVVSWAAGKNIKDKTLSYIQKISGVGELQWGEAGIKLNTVE